MAIIAGTPPLVLPPGLRYEPLPSGFVQIRCNACRCSIQLPHIPGGIDCQEAASERAISQAG